MPINRHGFDGLSQQKHDDICKFCAGAITNETVCCINWLYTDADVWRASSFSGALTLSQTRTCLASKMDLIFLKQTENSTLSNSCKALVRVPLNAQPKTTLHDCTVSNTIPV